MHNLIFIVANQAFGTFELSNSPNDRKFKISTISRKKRVSIQSAQDKNKLSNSISQSKMNTEPRVVSTQTTISSTAVMAEVKPQQVQAHTPDHKMYVNEMRNMSEASTATHSWAPGGQNGHMMVSS